MKFSSPIIALMLLLLAPAPQTLLAADYLTPELRERVEILKQDFRVSPTTAETYPQRAQTAWEWLNAYAMSGKPVPIQSTTTIRPVRPTSLRRGQMRGLDFYLVELTLLDEQPNALGLLNADTGPFESRSWVTLEQRYRVGEMPIVAGGGFLVARHFMPGYGRFQVEDSAGDNYVSISSDNPDVDFVPDRVPLSGPHGGFRGAQPALAFRVTRGELRPGEVVTITYGDRRGGSRGFRMSAASTDELPLPIYVDPTGEDHFYALPIQPIRVSGTALAGVHGFAPSVVRPGEKFALSVRAQDRYYNRAKGPIPSFSVFANGARIGRTSASDEAITVLEPIQIEEPGVYHITIASADGSVTGVGNPILVSADAAKVYWGDTHGHSGFAEGIGTPERFMVWARDDARLDFVTHSEHDIWMDDREWQVLVDNVDRFSEPGRFIGYLGYEWTTQNYFGGHHNVLFRDTNDRERVPVQTNPTTSRLYAGVRERYDTKDVLIIPHAHQAGDYRVSDPELENLVEIMSQHGTFEWFGRAYLSHGHQVGFIAASDNHLSQPGYTSPWRGTMSQRGGLAGVLATQNSRDGIFDAMKARRTYATTGDKIILDVKLNGANMGERIDFAAERRIEARVIGTTPIESVEILRNGEEVWRKDYLTIESGRYAKQEVFHLTFASPSAPMHRGDNPRGARGWVGTMTLKGAEIVAFESTDFFNPEVNRLERDAANPNVLHFVTGSRGDASSIRLTLRNIKRNAKISLALDSVTEYGSPTRFRPPATLPASNLDLAFRDIEKGKLRRVIPFDIYEDSVTLRRVATDGPWDVSFEFTDDGVIHGDYYYVRVKQANDAMAWSSPVWVGSFPPR